MAKISKAEIDAIKAANSESIDKFKASKKKSAGGRPKSPQSAETNAKSKAAVDDTIAELARQMGVPSSNNPSAPQGIGQAARPSNAPKGGTSTAQSAVAQINFAAQQMNTVERPYSAYDINRDLIRNSQKATEGIYHGFNYAVQGRAPMSQEQREFYDSGGSRYDAIIRAANKRDNIEMMRMRRQRELIGKQNLKEALSDERIEIRERRLVESSAAKRDNSLNNSIAKAIKSDNGEIIRALRDQGRKEASSIRSMRKSLHPDYRAQFDAANGIETTADQRREDFEEGTSLITKKGGRGRGMMAAITLTAAYHAINKMSSIAETATAQNTTTAQIAPGQEVLGMAAPLLMRMGMKIGGGTAFAASEALNIYKNYQAGLNMSVDAEKSMAMGRVPFGNDERYTAVMDQAKAEIMGSRTVFQRMQNKLGFTGAIDTEIQKAAARTISADEKASNEAYLYGNEGDNAILKWAAQNKIPVASVPDEVRQKLINGVIQAKRREFELDPEVLGEVEGMNKDRFNYGANGVMARDRKQIVDEIFLNGNGGAYGTGGRVTPARARAEADMKIRSYLADNALEIHAQDELSKNIELKMKAERHRHLAEF